MYIVHNNVVLLLGYSSTPLVKQDDQSIGSKDFGNHKKRVIGTTRQGQLTILAPFGILYDPTSHNGQTIDFGTCKRGFVENKK